MAVDLGVDDVGHQVVVRFATAQLGQLDTRTGENPDLGQRMRGALLEAGVVVIGAAEQTFGRVRHRLLVGGSLAEHSVTKSISSPARSRSIRRSTISAALAWIWASMRRTCFGVNVALINRRYKVCSG